MLNSREHVTNKTKLISWIVDSINKEMFRIAKIKNFGPVGLFSQLIRSASIQLIPDQ